MTYESWRISFQSSEAAARSAYKEVEALRRQLEYRNSDPFGYFKAEPFGWTDCSENDEGAVALYEHPTNVDELLTAVKEVIRISDRKHDAWDKAKVLIEKMESK